MSNSFYTIRGRITNNVPLGERGWFRCGGQAETFFKPVDVEDLSGFLSGYKNDIHVFGVLSNVIIRDGGVSGCVVRMGRAFANIEILDDYCLSVGAAALDMNVARALAQVGMGGLEFLSAIPGTIGGALRMNAGAYGVEMKDILVEAHAFDRTGKAHIFTPDQMGMGYRHIDLAEEYIFTSCILKGYASTPEKVENTMAELKKKKEETQPLRERTGGSTFANPTLQELERRGLAPDIKAWNLIDLIGGRGLNIGGAQISEKHCNFMINTGEATATDLEHLGEEIRRRVLDKTGIGLRWEIKRIGLKEKTHD